MDTVIDITQNLDVGRRLGIGISYDCLERLIPQVTAMKGFDQRNERHQLRLDEHTKEMDRLLSQDLVVLSLPPRKRMLVSLAAKLHDIGKPETATPHKSKAGQMTYIGHELRNAEMASEVLNLFDLNETEKKMVLTMMTLHATSLDVAVNFRNNDRPSGEGLKLYSDFIDKIREMPGSETEDGLTENMRLVIAFTKAEVEAGIDRTRTDNPVEMITKINEDIAGMERLESAIPAIIMAVTANKNGVQTAAIIKDKQGWYGFTSKQR